jgi:hypothetical protein
MVFSIAGFIGIRLFYAQMGEIINTTWPKRPHYFANDAGQITIPENQNGQKARWFLFAWAVMFAFIGAQLSYTLSPFFGDPSKDFILINDGGSNFFLDVLETLRNIK